MMKQVGAFELQAISSVVAGPFKVGWCYLQLLMVEDKALLELDNWNTKTDANPVDHCSSCNLWGCHKDKGEIELIFNKHR